MPIISSVGRRSWKVRGVYAAMFTLLILGGVSMVYPLLLMLSGSIKSQADGGDITPIPRYLFDDAVLWKKFVESKYGTNREVGVRDAEKAFRRQLGDWEFVDSNVASADREHLADYLAFRAEAKFPPEWFTLGHAKNVALYRKDVQTRYNDDIDAYARAINAGYRAWPQVVPPVQGSAYATRLWTFPTGPQYSIYDEFKAAQPRAEWIPTDLDAVYWHTVLLPKWGTVAAYNAAHGTTYADYRDVLLATSPPANAAQRKDWESFVRNTLNLAFVRVRASPDVIAAWQTFLSARYGGNLRDLNAAWGAAFADWSAVLPVADVITAGARQRNDWAAFVKDAKACPTDALSLYGPRQAFEAFVARNRGVEVADIAPMALPIEAADYADCQASKSAWRREFFTANYRTVIDFLILHGNGFRNTVIYCGLAVLTHLLVNPLAAYALSRYKLPATYAILLFCMATMAFPHEVTLIPAFLLLKRFPIVPIIVGIAVAILFAALIGRWRGKASNKSRIVAIALGVAVAYWIVPFAAAHLFGRHDASVSLLNTFWALILPGIANGYAIFLLKGFFDSLPKELYEAAELDGAGEWTKFWQLTMSLSKPILAVLALAAFTHAYSEFLMALVIIPDPNMWTIMVWLFQFQATAQQSEIYASLVVAAVPTMLIFIFCQNLIMRGIVVPTEK